MFSEGSRILSPVTSSGARFSAVLSRRGGGDWSAVKMQQGRVEPVSLGLGLSVPGDDIWPFCRQVLLGETRMDKIS